jgi:hypothetical protein
MYLYAVLWIRIGFSANPDPASYLNADLDPDLGSQTNADPDPGLKSELVKKKFWPVYKEL